MGPAPEGVEPVRHAFFPDGDALAGRLAVVWQDSREDDCYSVQRPASNTADATRCEDADGESVNSYVAVSTDGVNFGPAMLASSVSQMPQYEMFSAVDIPFLGDYNWIQLVELEGGSLFGYLSWTDNRDVVPETDPRGCRTGSTSSTGWTTGTARSPASSTWVGWTRTSTGRRSRS